MAKIKGVYRCKTCGSLAPIVRRYKGYEYRLCRQCNEVTITHIINGEIYPIRAYKKSTYGKYYDF